MSVIKQLGVKQSDGTYTVTDFSVKAENIDGDVIVWNLLPAVDGVNFGWGYQYLIKNYSYDYYNGTYTITADAPVSETQQRLYTTYIPMPLELQGQQCTLSIDEFTSTYANGTPRVYVGFASNASGTDSSSWYIQPGTKTKTFTVPADAEYYRLYLYCDYGMNAPEDTVVTFKGIKLELGNKATEWTPYLDDINKYTASLNNRTTALENKTTDEAIVNTVALNMKVGGRNLLIGSETKQLTKNPTSGDNAPTINYATNQSVAEWGATDAIRAYGSLANGATSATFASLRNLSGEPNRDAIVGTHYVHSIYIKNNHSTNQLNVTVNGLTAVGRNIHIYNPDSGETDIIDNTINTYVVPAGKIVKFVAMSIGSLTAQQAVRGLQFSFAAKNTSTKEFDFTYWHPQIEEGDTATEWEPSPYDNAKASELESLSNSLGDLAVKDSADWSDLSTKTKTLITAYGTCDTAEGTSEKVVTCSGFSLETGVRIAVKFTSVNVASNISLNVNNTGAKYIYARGSKVDGTSPYSWLRSNVVIEFVYDGTNWQMIGPPIRDIYYGDTSSIDGGYIKKETIDPSRLNNSIHSLGDSIVIPEGVPNQSNIFSLYLDPGKYLIRVWAVVGSDSTSGSFQGGYITADVSSTGPSSYYPMYAFTRQCNDPLDSEIETTKLIDLSSQTNRTYVYGYLVTNIYENYARVSFTYEYIQLG